MKEALTFRRANLARIKDSRVRRELLWQIS
ncbi:hypothetical protein V6Z11_A13G142900 [Gossypium hirsutum]